MSPMSQAAQNLNWLIADFVDNAEGVSQRGRGSADGLLRRCPKASPAEPRRAETQPCAVV
ncbi:hypothetical protein SGRIM128S_07416 [Streptomyces griseomycini]